MKKNNKQGYYLSILFIVLLYLFTRSFYTPFFLILLSLMLYLAFLKEENRLVAWMIISFFGGNLILFYLDKFIDGIQIDPFHRVIFHQLLFIIPILSICYVINRFNKKIGLFFRRPETWIQRPLALKRKYVYIIVLLIFISFLSVVMTLEATFNFHLVISLSLFVFIHAVLQEIMWRGILLTQFMMIANETSAILFTSLAFALNTTIFGFTLVVFILYFIFGLLLGFITSKCKSILPSTIAHALVLILLFIKGFLQLPI
ncbi:CPBP family intramembrane glutamic endopeptidase [Neobacillus vireti]|uniref:CPBP family intramembrane glutamic endopeptidase n=1 Tax=Neobacillus vireti TaxID=220686 RepID=UPI002FFFF139